MSEVQSNVLYYGDNLSVLGRHLLDFSVDLIYLDPPFNSKRPYSLIFKESSGAASEAQIEAFQDTWKWGQVAESAYDEVVTGPDVAVSRILRSFVEGLGRNNSIMAYLCMMTGWLLELKRVLKPDGTIYLHCDPAASHYLKVIMDSIFGAGNFLNEIIWCYDTGGRSTTSFPRKHDVILRYGKSPKVNFYYDQTALPRDFTTMHEVVSTDEEGRVFQRNIKGGKEYRYYQDKGVLPNDWWVDINALNPSAKERLDYPTQKPLSLLERIICASSREGDVILDPFCGCGTAIHAAHRLKRRWIGIDITYLAINLVARRMEDAFPGIDIEVIGEPKDLPSAQDLAKRDRWQFQLWAVSKIGGHAVGGTNPVRARKGADHGIDGIVTFFAGPREDYQKALVSVKGGEHASVRDVRDLAGVIQREKAPIGILITQRQPTAPMVSDAASYGFYENEFMGRKYPRIQILTAEDILSGVKPKLPQRKNPFAQAPVENHHGDQMGLVGE